MSWVGGEFWLDGEFGLDEVLPEVVGVVFPGAGGAGVELLAEGMEEVVVGEQAAHGVGEGVVVAGVDEDGAAGGGDVAGAAVVGGDDGGAVGEGFGHGQAVAFVEGGEDAEAGLAVGGGQVGVVDAGADGEGAALGLEVGDAVGDFVAPAAAGDEEQFEVEVVAPESFGGVEQGQMVLAGFEAAHAEDQRGGGPGAGAGGGGRAAGAVAAAWVGRGHSMMVGPGRPWAGRAAPKPRNSVVALRLMPAMRRACLRTLR